MEKYNLLIPSSRLDDVMRVVNHRIQHNEWLEVELLGNITGLEVLSKVFGGVNLGWSPAALKSFRLTGLGPCISVPFPETLPFVQDRMEDLASCERPTLNDWLNENGIGKGAQPSDKVCMQDALAILRRLNETPYFLYPELIDQLSEMRTLIHALIGTGENCCGATISESAEAVRNTTRLDAMDAFSYAIRDLLGHKDEPGVKSALNSINVKAEEPNALFVTIETGAFEATPENIEAANSFISNACEGRDIHLRII